MKLLSGLAVAMSLTLSSATAPQDSDPAREAFDKIAISDEMVMIPMRDGVRLQTDIYLPKGKEGPFPTIFWKTPYDMRRLSGVRLAFAEEAIRRGYAFVLQNERGRYFSEGDWEILGNPRTDGYDALTWLADQSWSNGKIGTMGCSSSAEWQLGLAAMDHPAHAAMIPMAAGAGIGQVGEYTEQGNWYKGGVHQTLFMMWLNGVQRHRDPDLVAGMTTEELKRIRHEPDTMNPRRNVEWGDIVKALPLSSWLDRAEAAPGPGKTMVLREPADEEWYKGGLWHERDGFAVPAFWFNSWFDVSQGPNLAAFNFARYHGKDEETRDGQYMVVAPTLHCGFYRIPEGDLVVGERNMGNANFPTPLNDMIYGFLDHYLKSEENDFVSDQPRVLYYTMGENVWKGAEQWPPANTEKVTWYLGGWGDANSLYGDGHFMTGNNPHDKAEMDTFKYDPMIPVPARGGGVCCNAGLSSGGVFDQKDIEVRNDVLVYTSLPLEEDMTISGHIRATLYVSSDAKDTDFTVKLVDVLPDGTAYNVDDSIQRVKYRNGFDKPELMQEGEVYELRFSPMSTSHTFKAGNRVRLEISSSKFPQYMRNLNTGGLNATATEAVIATNNVHHGGDFKSRIEMDVVKD